MSRESNLQGLEQSWVAATRCGTFSGGRSTTRNTTNSPLQGDTDGVQKIVPGTGRMGLFPQIPQPLVEFRPKVGPPQPPRLCTGDLGNRFRRMTAGRWA